MIFKISKGTHNLLPNIYSIWYHKARKYEREKMNEGEEMMKIEYQAIGTIHTPFKDLISMPIQSIGGEGIEGYIELKPKFIDCLKDLDGFSHIILLYHFHKSKGYKTLVKPFLDDKIHGVFSTRAPKRPNPIGLSVVKLIKIEKGVVHIENIDILDGTPLLDIKPYIPQVDSIMTTRQGWLDKKIQKFSKMRSDESFQD